ncbi:hypothetical protein CKALI_11400 [Corynebacterium kalinowskii]|uniref:Uncharacterized protein n=1 Tax=Corynebacterium kalinowskii TaxID=2675216 RepID=A0A6B8VNX2_9CORY|nr:hypothetical protein [Corynebacterium kalinowskii]QGU03124.1 hypothetical protein CKALI_11400 [Corynebacterium kalinowskii]
MLTKTHRIVEPVSGHRVGLARYRGTAHVEVGDLASIIPRFMVPGDQVYRFLTIGGRRFVSVHIARRWAKPWKESHEMGAQANTLLRILDWAEPALKEAEASNGKA